MDAPWHWVVLAVVVIALFGYKKLPDAARSLGRSLRIFKTEIKGMSEDDKARAEARETADAVPRPSPRPSSRSGRHAGVADRPPAAASRRLTTPVPPLQQADRDQRRHRPTARRARARTDPGSHRSDLAQHRLTVPRSVASSPSIGW